MVKLIILGRDYINNLQKLKEKTLKDFPAPDKKDVALIYPNGNVGPD